MSPFFRPSYGRPAAAVFLYESPTAPPPASGALDTTFGTGRVANTGGVDAVLEASGAVMIVDSVSGDFRLKRLLSNGTLTQVTTDLGSTDTARAVLNQPDGKIVVAGNSGNNFAVARYNTNLTLDTGFGVSGQVVTAVLNVGQAYAVALQGNTLLGAGSVASPANPNSLDLAVVRYSASGMLDTTFGSAGVAVQHFGDPNSEDTQSEARSLAVQPNGKIVVAGRSDLSVGAQERWMLTRLNANGTLDTGFGTAGVVRNTTYSTFDAVALDPVSGLGDTMIAVGYDGRYRNKARVQRYNVSGLLTPIIHSTSTRWETC